jgi:CMP-N-acetylneuraminic acid synthetase
MIIGVIPARGGSKGIPRKNLKEICGKPLIAWTIEAARKSKLLDKFVVSTEDDEIRAVSEKYGAKVLTRPKELANDYTAISSVLQHVVSKIDPDIIVVLQPTSAIRNNGLIDECIKQFIDDKADSLATGFYCTYREYATVQKRRQDIEGFFYDDGNVYVIKTELIKKGERFGKKNLRKVIDQEQNVEIDTMFDFWVVEQILKKRTGML